MISCCAQNGLFEESRRLLADMKFSGIDADEVTYSGIISSFTQNDQFAEGLVVFKEMISLGLKPDVVAITSILPAVSSVPLIAYCREIHGYSFRLKLESDRRIRNALVAAYSKCEAIVIAERIFQMIENRDVISWGSMIACYAQNEFFVEALDAFREMAAAKVELNPITMTSSLSACAGLSNLRTGKEIHLLAIKHAYDDQPFVSTALVDMYAKCGELIKSRKVFDLMKEKHLVTYNVMIGAYAIHGEGEKALEIFRLVEQPDLFSFATALSACSHCGFLEQAIDIFTSMKGCGLDPEEGHYACAIDLLARAGKLDAALDLVNKMPNKPTEELWGVLLGACKMHNNVGVGVYAGEQIFEIKSKNSGYYVLLSNMLADFGQWEGVQELRKQMRENRVKKVVGCSWIELDGVVYSFCARGADHSEQKDVCVLLNLLSMQMKEVKL